MLFGAATGPTSTESSSSAAVPSISSAMPSTSDATVQSATLSASTHRGLGTSHYWFPQLKIPQINSYYMYKGVYICPSCKVVVATQTQFTSNHRYADGFTSKKRDLYLQSKLSIKLPIKLINRTFICYIFVSFSHTPRS